MAEIALRRNERDKLNEHVCQCKYIPVVNSTRFLYIFKRDTCTALDYIAEMLGERWCVTNGFSW